MLPLKTLKEVLREFKLATPAILRTIQTKANKQNKSMEEMLIIDGAVNEGDLYEKAGKFLDVPFVGLKGKEIKKNQSINIIIISFLLKRQFNCFLLCANVV